MSLLANVGMFVLTAAICFGLVRGLRSFAFAGVGSPDYVLTTTRQIEAGEALSPDNAVWKLVGGRAPAATVVAHASTAPLGLYTAMSRIGPGKPVRMALVAKTEAARATPKVSALGGYVLSGEAAADILPYVKPGAQIDVVAIVSNQGDSNTTMDPATRVATVISNAEVTSVVHTPMVGHGQNRGMGSVVIAVSDDQARLLGVLNRFATLEYVLSPRRMPGIDQPAVAWRKLGELGLPGLDAATQTHKPTQMIRAAREPVLAANDAKLETDEQSVAVITPAGIAQTNVRN